MQAERFLISLIVGGFEVAAKSTQVADKVVRSVPGLGAARDRILDTVLGPIEEPEYTSTTAPLTTFKT